MVAGAPYELEVRGLTKRYPGVLANDRVDLAVRSGQIHAVVGENGAGKTTLMSMLYGLFPPDEGQIILRGQPVSFSSPLDAIDAGIGMVHQAFKLFPSLTVAENVVYRAEPRRFGLVDRRRATELVRGLAEDYGLAVDPTAGVEGLPVGVLQRVEILKALYRDARVLILDEPTAVLTPQEKERLFAVLRRLRERGHTIIFITHKLGEVMELSDHVTVLRDGRAVADLETAATDQRTITRHMIGRDVQPTVRPRPMEHGPPRLEVSDLRVAGDHGADIVAGVSLTVRGGEILGVAGVAGNGQTELIEAITGIRTAQGGTIAVDGSDVSAASPAERRRAGLAYIPEDRHRVGTAGAATARENLLMAYQREPAFQQRGWLRSKAVDGHARRLIADYRIRVSGPDTPVSALSGGNLQKVVVAREIEQGPAVLVAEQPTRGVDVGSIEFIHERLVAVRDAGCAVLLVSAELAELLALSTRIAVMYEGQIVGEFDPASTDEVTLGWHMTGGASVEGVA